MLLVTKASVTMPCETLVLGKLKIPVAVYIYPRKVRILLYVILRVLWTQQNGALSQAGSTSSPSVSSVVEMGSLLQVYAATGLNLPRKFTNTNGCGISFHNSSESQR